MLKDDQLPDRHIPSGGGAVQLKHIQDRLPKQRQVVFREPGGFSGQVCGNVALCPVKAVGDDVLPAHFGALFLRVGFRRDGYTGDRDLLGQNGVNASGKAQLYRAAHLTAIQGAFNKGRHDRAEGADVKKVGAHEVPELLVQIFVFFLGLFQLVFVYADSFAGLHVAAVQRNAVFHIDAVAGFALLGGLYIVSDLALQADVRDQTVAGFRVDPRHIACVGISVGVAVLNVKQNDKFITIFDWFHNYFSSFFV